MSKARSPAYPTIGLREAIEKVRQVYEKDYQNRIGRKTVAEHMGYNSLNGKSLGVLSAVGKYGLLEGRGEECRVTDLALSIIAHEPGTPERQRAILEAANAPELFAELEGRFPGGRASDVAIKAYLLTRKFIPSAADMAVRAYRETIELVQGEAGNYNPSEGVQSSEPESTPMMHSPNTASNQTKPTGSPAVAFAIAAPGEREYLRGPISKEISYRLLVTGDMGSRELGKIIRLLTLQKELLSEAETESEAAERPEE